jgi:hypothetical protein
MESYDSNRLRDHPAMPSYPRFHNRQLAPSASRPRITPATLPKAIIVTTATPKGVTRRKVLFMNMRPETSSLHIAARQYTSPQPA